MNDWLDYQGSGSSRAYIAHADDKSIFSKDRDTKQYEANKRLRESLIEQGDKIDADQKALDKKLFEYALKYKQETGNLKVKKKELQRLNVMATELRKTSPLEASRKYETKIYAAKQDIDSLNSDLLAIKADMNKIESDKDVLKKKKEQNVLRLIEVNKEIHAYEAKYHVHGNGSVVVKHAYRENLSSTINQTIAEGNLAQAKRILAEKNRIVEEFSRVFIPTERKVRQFVNDVNKIKDLNYENLTVDVYNKFNELYVTYDGLNRSLSDYNSSFIRYARAFARKYSAREIKDYLTRFDAACFDLDTAEERLLRMDPFKKNDKKNDSKSGRSKLLETTNSINSKWSNKRIKQSYFDMPADEFIMHTEKGGTSMNDWLDYQGSGSSRAYANDTLSHAAPMKKATSNGYDYLNSRLSELTKQEDELVALAGEAANLMNTAYGKLRTAYGKLQIIDKKMATMDKAGWDIEESINRGNFSAMQKEALTNKLNSIGKRGQAKLAAMYVPIDTVDDIRSSLQSALSNFTVVGHSYSGNSDDEFIEHAAKSSVENAREAATVRASIKSTISEMDKLDLAITQLGNQLDRTSRSDLAKSSTAKADALDAREKNIRANAIQKYNEWKKKRSNLVSLISQYERLTSGDSNFIKDAKEYISDPYPTNISDRAFRTLGLWPE